MLLERVRRAVAPDYEILAEIAGGGMGLVFIARQRRLDRKVAIKILRPEHATAIATERFLAEGRVLARLAHPNIVPVYDAGEADGLLYYVMEYVEGETLAERLSRGPLTPQEARHFTGDLLGALSSAHALGIVHRDVKPANIFLRGGRALLGDFGIARWREKGEPGFTTPGEMVGTPRYMAPEQRDGLPATPRTDVYAAGLVIWEACSGMRWPFYQNPREADWSKLPPGLAVPVRKALELEPEDRWDDARAFAAQLVQRPRRHAPLALAAAVAAALIAWALWPSPKPEPNLGFPIELGRIALQGAASPAERDLGDSVAAYLRRALGGFPDFYVPPAGQRLRDPRTLRIAGTAQVKSGELQLVVEEGAGAPESGERIHVTKAGAAGAWQSVADSLAVELVYQVWRRAASDPFFPDQAIPQSPVGRAQLARADQLFSLGRWDDAARAYQAVEGSCLLCVYRSLDIARWFGLPHDPEQLIQLRAALDRFPLHYRPLIRATALPLRERLDTLERAANDFGGFFLAPFEYGDELFHRGPLIGRLRAEAVTPFRTALLDRPGFQPGLEHLTWVLIATGDSAGARTGLQALQRLPLVSGLSGALTMLRSLGFHWRFLSVDTARRYSAALLDRPEVRQNLDAAAGARLLMSMDAPRGAVELGAMLAEWPQRSDAVLPGLLGRLYGFAALGQLDSLRATGKRFAHVSADRSYALLALELEAVLRSFDPDSTARDPSLREELTALTGRLAADPALRWRASWALGLLAAESGDTAALSLARDRLRDEPEPAPLRKILEAAVLGRNDARRALLALPSIPSLDQEVEYADPLEDAVVHLLRAQWQQREDSLAQASRTLRWHEHTQISGHMTGPPQPGELAWALGTLAQWKRANLLSEMDDQGAEWCSVTRSVARLWAEGDAIYRVRAERAKQALTSPACATGP